MTHLTGDGLKSGTPIDVSLVTSETTEQSLASTVKELDRSMNDDPLMLYILMRTDLDSLNPGKAMAQASHAFGALRHSILSKPLRQKDYAAWQAQTPQGFGTTVVLGGKEGGIQRELDRIHRDKVPLVAGWVHDPTYPVKDGDVTHLVPLNTCAFVFGTRDHCINVRLLFNLHK